MTDRFDLTHTPAKGCLWAALFAIPFWLCVGWLTYSAFLPFLWAIIGY